ncbi:hypothetical protein RND81_04G188200 [Saponaria officinalis]|uniref:Uncharacterized protein n=1 Tax=Saponaria officinalis TaxID=3572 RepID=A0AAW1LFW1_SAPOF
MAGNVKFEVSSVSPDDSGFSGGYPNGPRGSYSGPSLDRSGSFREVSDGRSFSSGAGSSKLNAAAVTDLPQISQCLNLEPIAMGDSKYTRAGELRRALGVLTFGNVSEDNSFAGAQSRPPPTFNTDEVKRFRSTIMDGSMKARTRVKKFDELLNKLNKYYDVANSKKQQINDRSGGSNMLKMGTQSHRMSPELAAQKLEDRNKNVVLNKRARTPMGDLRAEGRNNSIPRQPIGLGKDKDSAKEGSSDIGEEKIRRLPAGGEGWDKKMKRKRSVSSVCPRPLDGDGELKRSMHGKIGNDPSILTSDGHGFRSGSANGASSSNKVDGSPSSASLNGRMTPKNEPEKTSQPRELAGMNKERLLQKGNTKLNIREEPHLFSPSSITKGKASRAHRRGPGSVGNSSPNFSRMAGTPEDCQQPLNVNKVHSLAGVNNRKRPLPTDSSSPPMAQWGGQRPQKISRNRRTNIVSPTSNPDEVQIPAEGCPTPDFSTRISGGMNGPLPVRNIMSSSQQLKAKLESAKSPARLSESEENSGVENRLKDKVLCGGADIDDKGTNDHQNASPGFFTKKSKLLVKDEIGDGARIKGRSGRGSSFSKGNISPLREKPDSPAVAKPARSSRPGSEKNGSKSGRPPLKKHSDRKGFRRSGPVPNTSSPDFTGESDDDREEILAAALFACNASYNGCSSSFWKRLEPVFYVRAEDKTFLEEQLKAIEKQQSNQTQIRVLDDNMMNHVSQMEARWAPSFVSGESKICLLDNGLTEPTKTGDFISQFQDHDSSYRGLDPEERPNNLSPLYQRVLSALIVEDEFEEYKDNHFASDSPSIAIRDDPCTTNRIFCNGNASQSRFSSTQISVQEEIDEGDYSLPHPNGQAGPGPYQNEVNGSLAISIHGSGSSSLDCDEYDQMCMDDKLLLELQSIGLYPDTVPDLAEGEDELINEDIAQLRKQLYEQAGKKKAYFERIHGAIENNNVLTRDHEKVAMDRLVELAFRKLLATRGNYAVRIGISKVSKHVALAFIKRTLARCHKYEETGKSCFSEPALQEILLAAPSNNNGVVPGVQAEHRLDARASGYPVGSEQLGFQNAKPERSPFDAFEPLSQSDHAFAKNGPILNRGKKKEVLLDDVGGNASLRGTPSLGSTLHGGTKGKRSERDSSAKAGRPSLSNSKGERKTKSKPKQKAAQLSTHPVQSSATVSGELVTNAGNRRREDLKSPGHILDSSKDENMDLSNLPLTELDSIEDLNVVNEFEGHQDLSSWLNFDEVEGLQDDDGFGGLQIPMDDLSDLNMLL